MGEIVTFYSCSFGFVLVFAVAAALIINNNIDKVIGDEGNLEVG